MSLLEQGSEGSLQGGDREGKGARGRGGEARRRGGGERVLKGGRGGGGGWRRGGGVGGRAESWRKGKGD